MNSFEDLCIDLSEELGRQLNVEEIEFLRWVYGRHMEEMDRDRDREQIRSK